jgi:hypothetical protein
MAKIKKPTKENYEEQSKGQGVGQTTGQGTGTRNNLPDEPRVIGGDRG